MRWEDGQDSSDVEDRRGEGGGGFGFGGLHIGLGGAVVLFILSLIFRRNLFTMVGDAGGRPQNSATVRRGPVQESSQEHRSKELVTFVLDDVQKTWEQQIFPEIGKSYRHARLVLFRDETRSACGAAESATGPFYCPGDERVYIDLGFCDELRDRFGAPGDFAQAYVIAHELGHHVQNLLGIERRVNAAMQRYPSRRNALSVRLELQADCFAGIWGNSTAGKTIKGQPMLEPGDVEAGLRAAAAVGDDRLQRMAGRGVNPESFTHGSSQQRMTWFRRGFDSGRLGDCDTFKQ